GLRLHPHSAAMYRALAQLEVREGRSREAVACLRRGLGKVPGQGELLRLLAELLISEGDLAGAREALVEVRKLDYPAPRPDFLEARARFKEGNWLGASRLLEDTRPLLEEGPEQVAQVDLLLGQCYQRLGDERQLDVFRRAADLDPQNVPARFGVAYA